MKTVNSLSGGKISSYIAMNYPADYELFALVCIDCHNAGAHIDRKMKQMVNDKLQKHCSDWPEFVATAEDPKILKVMFDLEQKIGREIIWLRGMGWDEMIRYKKAVPNIHKRFCTTVMKMTPIFNFLYLNTELPVKMRIGFRYDEMERMHKTSTIFKFPHSCQMRKKLSKRPIPFPLPYQWNENSLWWFQRWKKIEWRINEFPLIEDKIIHYTVQEYWKDKDIDFPEDSNCQMCFWKANQQLKRNFKTNDPIMTWAMIKEELEGNTLKDLSLRQIEALSEELEFFFGTGSGCQAGFCTD